MQNTSERKMTATDPLVSLDTVEAGEAWREYEFGPENDRVTYSIDNPHSVEYRLGGTTHRVWTADDVCHILPAPGFNGCVVRVKLRPQV